MARQRRRRQAGLLAALHHPHELDQSADILLRPPQAHEFAELREQRPQMCLRIGSAVGRSVPGGAATGCGAGPGEPAAGGPPVGRDRGDPHPGDFAPVEHRAGALRQFEVLVDVVDPAAAKRWRGTVAHEDRGAVGGGHVAVLQPGGHPWCEVDAVLTAVVHDRRTDQWCRCCPYDQAAAAGFADLAPLDARPAVLIHEYPGAAAVLERAVAHSWPGGRPSLQSGLRRPGDRAVLDERVMRRVLDPDADRRVGDGRLLHGRVATALDLQGGHPGRLDGATGESQHGPARGPDAMFRRALDRTVVHVDGCGAVDVDRGEGGLPDHAFGQPDRCLVTGEDPVGAGVADSAVRRREPRRLLRHQASARALLDLAAEEIQPAVAGAEGAGLARVVYLAPACHDVCAARGEHPVAAGAGDRTVGQVGPAERPRIVWIVCLVRCG